MRWLRFVDEAGETHWGEPAEPGLARVHDADPFTGPAPTGRVLVVARRLAPVPVANLFCIGRNYRAHAAETGAAAPRYPVVFMKPTTAVCGPGDAIRIPRVSVFGPEVDYEAELAVVIGREARDVPVADALSYVLGYTVANDVSARRWQKHAGGGQYVRGKGFDTFAPLGPELVTGDELPDPQVLTVRSRLNGELMQEGHTSGMIFPVAELVSFLSQDTTLLPGTVILTGTPEGVGFVRRPPVFLTGGDVIEVEVEGIGTLRNPVVGDYPPKISRA